MAYERSLEIIDWGLLYEGSNVNEKWRKLEC